MKDRVFFEGPIYEKKKLYELYNTARVFILPSRWEGFPLVGPEAAHCGCRMILTDIIPPIKELTDNQRYGISIKTNDVEAIKKAIIEETHRVVDENEPTMISEYAEKELSWDGICRKLVEFMKVEQ